MLSGDIAGRLGRISLNRSGPRTSADRESANGTAGPYLSMAGNSEVNLGRLTSGMAGGIVIGLVLFYIWTRKHQA